MKNRQLHIKLKRNDLTYPEWVQDQLIPLKLLFEDFREETLSSMDFQSFSIEMYMDTTHAENIANKRN